ncbi:MAG: phosphoglucosamine mutase, partial [bacterium]
MTLIKSISGIRGTIGDKPGEGLSPIDIVKFSAAYAEWLKQEFPGKLLQVIVGRDARVSGTMVNQLVTGTLAGCGINVIDGGMITTPTVELAVLIEKADGGIIITASHNPGQWNALKLLNYKGEFLSATDGAKILDIAEKESYSFSKVDNLGQITSNEIYTDLHIKKILELPLVSKEQIKKARFKVAIDCVNSVGGIVIPRLLKELGVTEICELYCEPNGLFPHNPEPLPENLKDISNLMKAQGADVGFVVDPDVDRLAIINEDGTMFGEEYTLVAVADYILSNKIGNTVSNLSSSMALRDVTRKYGGEYHAAAVGEVNVVKKMKEVNAIIGGEGNGGVIYPTLHHGRDALVGIALFLTFLAKSGMKTSELKALYPGYYISKNKIELTPGIDVDGILENIKKKYKDFQVTDIDGV